MLTAAVEAVLHHLQDRKHSAQVEVGLGPEGITFKPSLEDFLKVSSLGLSFWDLRI